MGNAVYRDLIQAMVMVDLEHLILGVSMIYKYQSGGRGDVGHVSEVDLHLEGGIRIVGGLGFEKTGCSDTIAGHVCQFLIHELGRIGAALAHEAMMLLMASIIEDCGMPASAKAA